jgi:hypothetical protein
MPVGRPFSKDNPGNLKGRPKAPVDLAEMARAFGPRAIGVVATLLDDADSRVRLAAAKELLDRGYGRPAPALTTTDGEKSFTFLHLVAARASGEQLRNDLIEGRMVSKDAIGSKDDDPRDLMAQALE